ncbi:MAG: hypothetical protein JWQ78_217 [Sediminibacterium sp.]|nr:hypothetical protein [Sediminibacterium sp.]
MPGDLSIFPEISFMKDIFDPVVAAGIIGRMNLLGEDSPALWGKMNVGQMLAHVQVPIEVALGDKQLKRTLIGLLFGKMAKKKLFDEKPFPKSLPTDPSFVRKGEHDMTTEKQKVTMLLNRLVSAGHAGISQLTHPFFGKMTPVEWGTSLYKHLDHHLRQFGV